MKIESLEIFAKKHDIFTAISSREDGPMGKLTNFNSLNQNNLARFLWKYDTPLHQVVLPKEMQTGNVCAVNYEEAGSIVSLDGCGEEAGVDGLVTSDRNLFLVGFAYDCLVIMGVDVRRRLVFIGHAGWLGLKNKLPMMLMRALLAYGSNLSDVHVWLGPTIEWGNYEFGKEDAISHFPTLGRFIMPHPENPDKVLLGIREIAVFQLQLASLPSENIEFHPGCITKDKKFFSYRGGDPVGSNMAFVIGFR